MVVLDLEAILARAKAAKELADAMTEGPAILEAAIVELADNMEALVAEVGRLRKYESLVRPLVEKPTYDELRKALGMK